MALHAYRAEQTARLITRHKKPAQILFDSIRRKIDSGNKREDFSKILSCCGPDRQFTFGLHGCHKLLCSIQLHCFGQASALPAGRENIFTGAAGAQHETPPPAASGRLSSRTTKTSHSLPSGSCTQVLS